MEQYYNIENLINDKKFAYRNSFVMPISFALSKIMDYGDLSVVSEKFEEMKSNEILDYLSLNEEEYETILRYCLLYNINKGVSEVGILSLNPLIEQKLIKEFKIKTQLFIRANDVDEKNINKTIKELKNNEILTSIYIDPYFAGDELCSKISEISGKFKIPVLLQMLDDLEKTGMINSIFDKLPINYIEDLGFLDRDCTLLGCSVADKEDFSILANYGAKVIVNTYESLNFGRGSPNIYAMQSSGLEVQIASPILNVIEKEIEFASVVSRGILNDPSILPVEEVLNMTISKNERIKIISDYSDIEEKFKKILEKIKEKI